MKDSLFGGFDMLDLNGCFFCGAAKQSPQPAPKPKVTIEELIRRKKSVVRVDGKLYRVEVSEVSA